MKRFILGLVMLVGLVLTVGEASAAKLTNIPLGWRYEATGLSGNVITYNAIGAGATDTTTAVSTSNWALSPFQQGLTASDSVVVARLIVAIDSTTATNFGAANTVTVTVDGGIGGDASWTQLFQYTVLPTSTDKMLAMPLFVSNSKIVNKVGNSNWFSLAPALRFRISGSGAIAAARVYVQAFTE